jgi:hypothetical protein
LHPIVLWCCTVTTILCLLALWGVIEVRGLRREVQKLRTELAGTFRAERQVTAQLLSAVRAALKLGGLLALVVERGEPINQCAYQSGYYRPYNGGKHDPAGP